MTNQSRQGPYSLRKRLHDATQEASEHLAAMTYEERREAGRKAFERFTEPTKKV